MLLSGFFSMFPDYVSYLFGGSWLGAFCFWFGSFGGGLCFFVCLLVLVFVCLLVSFCGVVGFCSLSVFKLSLYICYLFHSLIYNFICHSKKKKKSEAEIHTTPFRTLL